MARQGLIDTDTNKFHDSVFKRDQEPNCADLDDDLRQIVEYTLMTEIPPEHLRSLQIKILRGTQWLVNPGRRNIIDTAAAWANCYHNSRIELKVPLKWKWELKQMLKARGDLLWTLGSGKTFWGRAPNERYKMTDKLLTWAIRHEFGHAVDIKIKWTATVSNRPEFGGWSKALGPISMLKEIMKAEGVYDLRQEKISASYFLSGALRNFLDLQNRENRARVVEEFYKVDSDKALINFVCDLIEAGAKQPWLTGDLLVHEGRVYSYAAAYDEWYSFDANAYQRRVSNYQFATPDEWFAEFYAARYGKNTGKAMYYSLYQHMDDKYVKPADDIIAGCLREGLLAAIERVS